MTLNHVTRPAAGLGCPQGDAKFPLHRVPPTVPASHVVVCFETPGVDAEVRRRQTECEASP